MEKKTPLHDTHRELGVRMASFAGWAMPIQYEGILAEHLHCREKASLFDICHMGEFLISGAKAGQDLERLLTQPIQTLQHHQCRYGFLLNEEGGVLDDLTCYRLGDDQFYLVVNAANIETDADWIREHLSRDTHFDDRSASTAKLDLQGPWSRKCLEEALAISVPNLKFFRVCELEIEGTPYLLSRTGYTGEWGYELYVPTDYAVSLWERLLGHEDVKPAGLGARDTLRLEVGYPLHGHELTADRTPVGATGGSFINLDKDFIGKGPVQRELAEGPRQKLVGLQLATKRAARAGDTIFADQSHVGTVTSGSLSPSLGVAIALAYVDTPFSQLGQELTIEVRGTHLDAKIVGLPFYKEGSARKG